MQDSRAEALSERSARALRREKRKEHPSASPAPTVKAVKPVKTQKRTRPACRRRSVNSSDEGCVRPGLPYGESDSGEECINVALPQYILDRIKAEEDEDKRVEAESKESVEGSGDVEPARSGVGDPTIGSAPPSTDLDGSRTSLPVALDGQQPDITPVSTTDAATPTQRPAPRGPGGDLPELVPSDSFSTAGHTAHSTAPEY